MRVTPAAIRTPIALPVVHNTKQHIANAPAGMSVAKATLDSGELVRRPTHYRTTH